MAYASISKPGLHFNTKLYTGNATDDTAITGVGFQPDLCWFKVRSQSYSHNLQDAVRGAGKRLEPDQTTAESTYTSFKSFDTDGFTLGTGAALNGNGDTFVSWNWKAANSSGSSNTDGNITSTVSANTTAGFSIVSYTGNATSGATIGHGLGAVPKWIFTKNRDEGGGNQDWCVYHVSIGANKAMFLNLQNSPDTNAKYFNDTTPTSSVFTVGDNLGTNGSGDNMIAYCFAEKTGYSKFGSYTGNNNADGTFVYTGFAPSFVIIKRNASGYNWYMFDKKRDTQNTSSDKKDLDANNNSVEATDRAFDWLSNGIKFRDNNGGTNASDEYIYMAFAEEPLVANVGQSIPETAR